MPIKYPQVNIYDFEVWYKNENRQLLIEVGKKLNATVPGVPFTVFGEKYFTDWYNEQSTGAAIEDAVKLVLQKSSRDVIGELLALKPEEKNLEEKFEKENKRSPIPQKIKVPFLGEIETKNLSLPVLAVIFGNVGWF